jgi:hypothetical protein
VLKPDSRIWHARRGHEFVGAHPPKCKNGAMVYVCLLARFRRTSRARLEVVLLHKRRAVAAQFYPHGQLVPVVVRHDGTSIQERVERR